jgi:hypothetical protein
MSRSQYLGLLLAAFAGGFVANLFLTGIGSAHATGPQEVKIVDWPYEKVEVRVDWPSDAVKAKVEWPSDALEVKLVGPTAKGKAIAIFNHGH